MICRRRPSAMALNASVVVADLAMASNICRYGNVMQGSTGRVAAQWFVGLDLGVLIGTWLSPPDLPTLGYGLDEQGQRPSY